MTTTAMMIMVILVETTTFATGKNDITDYRFIKLYDWKWDAIANECEHYLRPNGKKGIEISLANRNIYYKQSELINRNLNIFQDEFLLIHMIKRCNDIGVRVYVAGIFNNLSFIIDSMGTERSYLHFFRKLYNSYTKCSTDTGNCQVCDIDLMFKEIENVPQKIIHYMNHLVNLGVAGFNTGTSRHVLPIHWKEIQERVENLSTNHGFDVNTRPLFYEDYTDVETLSHKNNQFLSGRNTIVHLFEWKWNDIAEECERFLGPKGYAGVQISPPNENQVITSDAFRPWWERYQPVSYKLSTRSGNEFSLMDMIRRCNAVGVRVYADVVINHMAAAGGSGTDGTFCDSTIKYYPGVPYTINNFHSTCEVNNYNDATNVRNCEVVHLRDLDQSQEYVRHQIVKYLNHLVSLGIAGFRIDAAKHMWPADLKIIYNRVNDLSTEHGFSKGTRPFFYQEVIDLGGEAVSKREYVGFGAVLEFKFGAELGNSFQGNNPLKYLKNWGPEWGLLDGKDAVAFIDNHDNQRGTSQAILTYKKPKRYKMAIAFMLAHPYGTTRIMSSFFFDTFNQGPPNHNGEIIGPGINDDGSCTNGWVCEHRWRQIYNMVGFRNTVEGTVITNWWDNDENQIAFGRGEKGFIVFTLDGDIDLSLRTSLPTGIYCDIISGNLVNGVCTGKSVEVDINGYATISIHENEEDGVIAIHVDAKL